MTTGCIRCGAHAAFVMHPLESVACEPCMRLWLNEESCSVEVVEQVIGAFGRTGRSYVEHEKAFADELEKRTVAWAKAGRKAAA